MKKILLVDDDIAMIRLYQLHLRKLNAELAIFNRTEPVIERLDTLNPDLAILDYDLPDGKGHRDHQSFPKNKNTSKTFQ